MKSLFGLLIISLTLSLHSFAQDQDYSLLWEVRSPDNPTPSYLFGTMHLKSDKVFNLPDTLIPLIESVEGFSLEVNFDSALVEMTNRMFNADTLIREKDTEEEKAKMPRFSYSDFKSFKKSIEDVDILEVEEDEEVVEEIEIEEVPEHEMILDAYLLYLAKRNDKTIYGLEQLSDQIDVMDERLDVNISVDTNSSEGGAEKVAALTIDTLIALYQRGYHEEIYDFIFETGDSTEVYNLLDRRNFKMAENIAKLSADRSMFYAIGSGHLGGPNGVVALLRQAGLEVTPVRSTFTRAYEKQEKNAPELKWHDFEVPNAPFAVQFQNKPNTIVKQLQGTTLYTSFDVFHNRFLSAYSIALPRGDKKDSELLDQYIDAIDENLNIVDSKKIHHEGVEGRETYYYRQNFKVYNRFFYYDDQMVFLEYIQSRYSSEDNDDMQYFFESLSFRDVERAGDRVDWQSFTDSIGAVRVYFPGTPKKQVMPVDTESGVMNLHLLSQSSPTREYNYLFRWYDLALGNINTNDTATIQERMDSMAEEFGEVLSEEWVSHKGLTCLESTFDVNQIYRVGIKECIINNRSYTAMAQYTDDAIQEEQATYFLDSFEPLEALPANFKRVELDSLEATLLAPSAMELSSDYYWLQDSYLSDTAYNYYGKDPYSSEAYMLFYAKYNKFFYKDSLEAWVREEIEDYMSDSESDSLSELTFFNRDGIMGGEGVIYKGTSNNIYRLKTFINGRHVYTLGLYSNEAKPHHDAYFESFEYSLDEEDFDPFTKKGDEILMDLKSADTAVAELAEDMLDSAQFNASELTSLKALVWDSLCGINEFYAQRRLLEVIASFQDSSNNAFFDSLLLHHDNEVILRKAVEEYKVNDSVAWMASMIRNTEAGHFPIFEQDDWMHFGYFKPIVYDTIPKIIEHLGTWENMIGIWGYNEVILTIYSQLREKDERDVLMAHREQIAQAISNQIEFAKIQSDTGKVSEYVNEGLRECFELVKYLDSDDSDAVLRKLEAVSTGEVQIQILLALFERTGELDAEKMSELAANPFVHIRILESVEENPKLKKSLNSNLFDQERVARSLFLSEMDWAGPHEELRLLESREVKVNGKKSRLYVYQYRWDEEIGWVLGVSGAQPIKKGQYELNIDFVYTNWDTYNPAQYDESVEALIQEATEGYE